MGPRGSPHSREGRVGIEDPDQLACIWVSHMRLTEEQLGEALTAALSTPPAAIHGGGAQVGSTWAAWFHVWWMRMLLPMGQSCVGPSTYAPVSQGVDGQRHALLHRHDWPNCCHMVAFPNGGCGVGLRSDDGPLFGAKDDPVQIVSLTLGAKQTFRIRPRAQKGQRRSANVPLSAGESGHDGGFDTAALQAQGAHGQRPGGAEGAPPARWRLRLGLVGHPAAVQRRPRSMMAHGPSGSPAMHGDARSTAKLRPHDRRQPWAAG